MAGSSLFSPFLMFFLIFLVLLPTKCIANDIIGCGGFVKSHVPLDFSKIEIGLYTKEGILKEKTECAPTNGYYFLPLYEKGDYILKINPPAGWSFEPSVVPLMIDGEFDRCTTGQDINFSFNGFGITGKVLTAGQKHGPKGVSVQLINEQGEVWNTFTAVGGDFHFTPVIPGKYVVKASHSKWKLEPSQAVVQVKEGNTVLPEGVLIVKGYDVRGTVTSYGEPFSGLYVLLYSKEDNQKFRVEGCNTALLQGVPDAPICHSVSDASGEFSFGLVPAGEYKLLALSRPLGQNSVSYLIKSEEVTLSVKHDSLYIKNAFEVIGYTLNGKVLASSGGSGLKGVQVSLNGGAVGVTDSNGVYILKALQPGAYTATFKHEKCEIDPIQVTVSSRGVHLPAAIPSRWQVCGSVTGSQQHEVSIVMQGAITITVPTERGKWCTFLAPGVYTASVELTDKDQAEGVQYYPASQQVAVGHGPVSSVSFSQLSARVQGTLSCGSRCSPLTVTLRPAHAHTNTYTTHATDGKYVFENVPPSTIEVSVSKDRLCWRESSQSVVVDKEEVTVPEFLHTGYVINVHSTHDIKVEYASKRNRGTLTVPTGSSTHCLGLDELYTLTPAGCHRVQPPSVQVDTRAASLETIQFIAVSHSVTIRVLSPEPVEDLILIIDGQGTKQIGPLTPLKQPSGVYVYEHTMFMAEGEIASVSARSEHILLPKTPQQVIGSGQCQPNGVQIEAARAVTLAGRVLPPTAGVTITLARAHTREVIETYVTKEDGSYKFGPLDASKQYTITAEKESYVFSGVDSKGNIVANKLAELNVRLVDDSDGAGLQGGVVTVSGGSYRRNLVSGVDGMLHFGSLAPIQYYAKPLMKEYKFSPPHIIVTVDEGKTYDITLRGVRVAWSCTGRVSSLGGAGWAALTVRAVPQPPEQAPLHCAAEEGNTDQTGHFRIRGLLPDCVYSLQLKESTDPELFGLRLVHGPQTIEVKENKDIEGVVLIASQPSHLTDVSVLVYTPQIEHYKSLRITLALEETPHTPIYTARVDPAGYNQHTNPGVMYALPRLPADNNTYILQLESTLSKSTHTYNEQVNYFNSDGKVKHFNIEFLPKVKGAEQELGQWSVLVIPMACAVVLALLQRDKVWAALLEFTSTLTIAQPAAPTSRRPRNEQGDRTDVLDRASIEQIVSSVNAAGKKPPKRKML